MSDADFDSGQLALVEAANRAFADAHQLKKRIKAANAAGMVAVADGLIPAAMAAVAEWRRAEDRAGRAVADGNPAVRLIVSARRQRFAEILAKV